MKKYNLSAEFEKWEGAAQSSSQPDSFGYVVELESEEEAKIRLEALIIDRMSSKPGWSYKLLNSSISEFPASDTNSISLDADEMTHTSEDSIQTEDPIFPILDSPEDAIPPDQPAV